MQTGRKILITREYLTTSFCLFFFVLAQVFLANYSTKHMSSFDILIYAYDSSGNTKRIIFNDYANISITFFSASHTLHKSIHSIARTKFNNKACPVKHLGLSPDLCCCQVTDLRDGQK